MSVEACFFEAAFWFLHEHQIKADAVHRQRLAEELQAVAIDYVMRHAKVPDEAVHAEDKQQSRER